MILVTLIYLIIELLIALLFKIINVINYNTVMILF